ncbi:uncharacterized protein LOC132798391 [Drosophila nasuta]|uniref:uncharacterized protein LOC132798391 n=1 Tax=Drosophila nasuta TaxID=42062 RepID=UPI00295E8B1E|nr:uncharacterized protein LOC132798391 [Drosophila nasuta]
MRCILVLVLVALSFVSTAPTRNNLKEDLTKLANETTILYERAILKCHIIACQKVVDNKNNKQTDIEKVQMYLNKLVDWDETWPKNAHKFSVEKMEGSTNIFINIPSDTLNNLVNGDMSEINLRCDKLRTQILDEFEARATEIIRSYREAGYTDAKMDEWYNKFLKNRESEIFALLS